MENISHNELFINRELSWLEFNKRVLDLSRDKYVPLGEQLKFAAIYASNLDEFFMVRVGSLQDQTLLKSETKENKTNMTATQQLEQIMPRVKELQKVCDKAISKLFLKLKNLGIKKINFNYLKNEEEIYWEKYFMKELYPLLSPQIIDKRHPFPFLRNGEIYISAIIEDENNKNPTLGIIPISSQFNRLIIIEKDNKMHFALVEELILHFMGTAFGKSKIIEKCAFRLTRNADINIQEGMFDHDIDYRQVMSELLKKRRKLAPVRLQLLESEAKMIQTFLLTTLELANERVVVQHSPLELSILFELSNILFEKEKNAGLFYPEIKALKFPENYELYKDVKNRDLLLCYPYHDMQYFIKMLNDAAMDKDVISIKMTLYRVAPDSKIIEALVLAAENCIEVVTVVELRARFDEENNINWSRRLENAGCTVIYGFTDYKVHSKLALITKKSGSKIDYISCVGTGNFNEKTSKLYTDLVYITGEEKTGKELATVFNNMALEKLTSNVENLIVAPLCFKSVLLQEIDKEINVQKNGGKGRIILKCNAISDKEVIDKLSKASRHGVKTDLIVRGICCLCAGIENISENISVKSIVGRYLEHSRIYAFGEKENLRIYIASGDFLTRNTERRVEVGIRIDDKRIKEELMEILNIELKDNVNSKVMQKDGSYKKQSKNESGDEVDSQIMLYDYFSNCLKEDMAIYWNKEKISNEKSRSKREQYLNWKKRRNLNLYCRSKYRINKYINN